MVRSASLSERVSNHADDLGQQPFLFISMVRDAVREGRAAPHHEVVLLLGRHRQRAMIVFLIFFALFWFLFIPAAIALFVPARYFGFAVAWMVMVAFVYALLPSGPDHSSPFSGLGDAADIFMYKAFAVAVGLKAGFIAFRRQSTALSPREAAALCALTGLVAGAFAIVWPTMLLSRAQPTWITHAGALVIAAGLLLAAWSWIRMINLTPRLFASAFAASAVVTTVAVGVWIASWVDLVVTDAESIAGERFYCIQIAAEERVGYSNGFAAATTRLDLSPFVMRAQCKQGWCWKNHAILVVDGESGRTFQNWSYRRARGFQDDVLNLHTRPPAVVCEPKPHFARDLPWF